MHILSQQKSQDNMTLLIYNKKLVYNLLSSVRAFNDSEKLKHNDSKKDVEKFKCTNPGVQVETHYWCASTSKKYVKNNNQFAYFIFSIIILSNFHISKNNVVERE